MRLKLIHKFLVLLTFTVSTIGLAQDYPTDENTDDPAHCNSSPSAPICIDNGCFWSDWAPKCNDEAVQQATMERDNLKKQIDALKTEIVVQDNTVKWLENRISEMATYEESLQSMYRSQCGNQSRDFERIEYQKYVEVRQIGGCDGPDVNGSSPRQPVGGTYWCLASENCGWSRVSGPVSFVCSPERRVTLGSVQGHLLRGTRETVTSSVPTGRTIKDFDPRANLCVNPDGSGIKNENIDFGYYTQKIVEEVVPCGKFIGSFIKAVEHPEAKPICDVTTRYVKDSTGYDLTCITPDPTCGATVDCYKAFKSCSQYIIKDELKTIMAGVSWCKTMKFTKWKSCLEFSPISIGVGLSWLAGEFLVDLNSSQCSRPKVMASRLGLCSPTDGMIIRSLSAVTDAINKANEQLEQTLAYLKQLKEDVKSKKEELKKSEARLAEAIKEWEDCKSRYREGLLKDWDVTECKSGGGGVPP